MECVHHTDDRSKQAKQWRGGHESRHETDFMADQLRGATVLQRRQRDEIAVPNHKGDDDDGYHQVAAGLQIIDKRYHAESQEPVVFVPSVAYVVFYEINDVIFVSKLVAWRRAMRVSHAWQSRAGMATQRPASVVTKASDMPSARSRASPTPTAVMRRNV